MNYIKENLSREENKFTHYFKLICFFTSVMQYLFGDQKYELSDVENMALYLTCSESPMFHV